MDQEAAGSGNATTLMGGGGITLRSPPGLGRFERRIAFAFVQRRR
jgi:hypothetical protein